MGDEAIPAGQVTQPDSESAALTPLNMLREEYKEKFEIPRLWKRFPAHTGKLVGEYQPINKKAVRKAAQTEGDEWLMASALVRILVDDPSSEKADEMGLVPLGAWVDKPAEDPIKLDARLCDILGIAERDPEKLALFLCENNDLLLADIVGEIGEWSTNTHDETIQDFKRGSRTTT